MGLRINTNTASIVTTQQVIDIEAAVGEFLTGVDIINASGLSTSEYRDGDSKAWDLILELLTLGVSGGKRLLAEVTEARKLRVYQEPSPGADNHFLSSEGDLFDKWDTRITSRKPLVGVWAELKDVIPASADVSKLATPSPLFIERATYLVRDAKTRYEPRGIPSPWDIVSMEQG